MPRHRQSPPTPHLLSTSPSTLILLLSCTTQLTALFRVPFNVLVTLALVLGLEGYRKEFLVGSGAAMLVAAGVAAAIARRAGQQGRKLVEH